MFEQWNEGVITRTSATNHLAIYTGIDRKQGSGKFLLYPRNSVYSPPYIFTPKIVSHLFESKFIIEHMNDFKDNIVKINILDQNVFDTFSSGEVSVRMRVNFECELVNT